MLVVEFAQILLLDPGPDQMPADIEFLAQSKERLAAETGFDDHSFQRDAMSAMLSCHGSSISEDPRWGNSAVHPAHPQRRTPEVHSWTRFLDSFTHYRTGETANDKPALMAAILADATNAGAERMAESLRGVTIHQMMVMVDRHLRSETYATAIAVLVDAHQAHPFAAVWGDGHISSSDGQFELLPNSLTDFRVV